MSPEQGSAREDERELRDEVARLKDQLESEQQAAEQWRQVAEERRVALEKLRQHPVIRVLVWLSRRILPPIRKLGKRAASTGRRARRTAGGVQGLPHRLTAPRREARLHRQIRALPDPPVDPRRVAIVVLTRDGKDNVARLVDAIATTTIHDQVELIVVDNASGPETRRYLERLERIDRPGFPPVPVRVLRNEENLSFAEANNRAVARAEADVVVLCNDDVEPLSRGWIRRLLAPLHGEVVAVGAQLVYPRRPLLAAATRDLGVQHRGIRFVPTRGGVPGATNVGGGEDPTVTVQVDQVPAATAACLAVDREAYEAVGGMDARYFYGAEDVDLCWRLPGPVVVARDAVLFHHEGATRYRSDPAELNRRQAGNWDAFAKKLGPEVARAVAHDRISGTLALTDTPLRVGITVTRDLPEAGYGDVFTAHELGDALEGLGWDVTYVERYRDAWYDLPELDVLVVLLDVFELPRVTRPGLVTIAWIRNWAERWTSHPWFDEYDLVLASSGTIADLVRERSRHQPIRFPLATNHHRFEAGTDERSGTVFTGNYWGKDVRLPEIVQAVPGLVVHGKGWDDVEGVRSAGPVPYEELPAVYRRARLVVDQAADHTRPYGSVNSRVFDALASGALPVTNQTVGASELFGDDLPTWETPDDLAELVTTLDDEQVAQRVEALRRTVLRHHTYEHRARTLQQLLLERLERPSIVLATSVESRAVADRWGDWHLAHGLAAEIRAAGHDVRIITADEWGDRDHRAPDVFVHLKGRSVAPRAEGQQHVIWNISHPEELTPEECAAADLVLVGSESMRQDVETRTDTPVAVMLQATDERRFRPRTPDPDLVADLVFVGNSRYVMRQVIRDALDAGLRPVIHGGAWEKFVDPDLLGRTHIPNDQLAVAYSSARVLLNDHWQGMRRWGYVSNRLFDALACGACVVSDDVPGLDELFDGAVVTYRTPDELRAHVDRLLADPEERRSRGERGRAAVLAAHTFRHRAQQLTALLQDPDLRSPAP